MASGQGSDMDDATSSFMAMLHPSDAPSEEHPRQTQYGTVRRPSADCSCSRCSSHHHSSRHASHRGSQSRPSQGHHFHHMKSSQQLQERTRSLLKQQSTRNPKSQDETIMYSEQDANDIILAANAPPSYSGNFDEIMNQIRAQRYYQKQFQRVQAQTEMSRFLYFSNHDETKYESRYLALAQNASVNRVRFCFLLGMISLFALYFSEMRNGDWDPDDKVGRTESDKLATTILCFGGMLPVLFLGIMSTFSGIGRVHLENVTVAVFLIIGELMIVKKPLSKTKGPVIPLLILLIPVFGITRMRFAKSCCVGWGLLVSYLIVQISARHAFLPKPDAFDSSTALSYQTINYGIAIIGGMVSQYRQELLRRRNFALRLPFSGTLDAESLFEMSVHKFARRDLLTWYNLKFNHPDVEECFYKYWYLIDAFPYQNPNSGSLHQGVFRVIRFAISTLLLNQVVLVLQDYKLLKLPEGRLAREFNTAIILRLGITVPLYLSAALVMYVLGKAFFNLWVKQAEDAKNEALRDSFTLDVPPSISSSPSSPSSPYSSASPSSPRSPLILNNASSPIKDGQYPQAFEDYSRSPAMKDVAEEAMEQRYSSNTMDSNTSSNRPTSSQEKSKYHNTIYQNTEPYPEYEGASDYSRASSPRGDKRSFKQHLVDSYETIKDSVLHILLAKGGYVRTSQLYACIVITTHVGCMGALLLVVSSGVRPQPVYYMGFLNAVLFAHRSGFRVRFVYATISTFIVSFGVVLCAAFFTPDYWKEYAGYMAVMFVLGMMISYEEESLRRTFFILKSMRMLEFEEWFGVVLRVQNWVKEKFRKRLERIREKQRQEYQGSVKSLVDIMDANQHTWTQSMRTRLVKPHRPSPKVIETSSQLAMASKMGMYAQLVNIIIALVDVLTSM